MNTSLSESELILSPEGAIYHLDLQPDEIADTVLIVGDPDRVKKVSTYFDRIEVKKQHREFITHTGYIGKKRISVLSTGIGTDNIDIVLNELDALVNIDFASRTIRSELKQLNIIRLGTSGCLQKDIPVDSVIVSDFGIGLDNLMLYYQHELNVEEAEILKKFEAHTLLNQQKIIPYIASSSRKLSNQFQNDFYHGITVTCPGFFGPQGRVIRAKLNNQFLIDSLTTFNNEPRITNFEMETSAIYGLGKILNHHCLSLNTVINNRIQKTFSKDMHRAVENMITRALAVVENI
jgi:uridine phosphorylase